MKSERAKEYIASLSCEVFPKRVGMPQAIKVGEIAEQEAEERVREELTRWHDPKEVLPEADIKVLVKLADGGYDVADYFSSPLYTGWAFNSEVHDENVVGWRYIPE